MARPQKPIPLQEGLKLYVCTWLVCLFWPQKPIPLQEGLKRIIPVTLSHWDCPLKSQFHYKKDWNVLFLDVNDWFVNLKSQFHYKKDWNFIRSSFTSSTFFPQKQIPLQEGLKRSVIISPMALHLHPQKPIPLQEGLKQKVRELAGGTPVTSKANSTTRRIETCCFAACNAA